MLAVEALAEAVESSRKGWTSESATPMHVTYESGTMA